MRYRTIVADPPWETTAGPKRGDIGKGWRVRPGAGPSRLLAYSSMTVAEIASVNVRSITDDDAALYLWTINAYVEQAYDVARAWGFKPSTLHTWCKEPMGGALGGAFGITSEYFLYARRGSPPERRVTGARGVAGKHTTAGHSACAHGMGAIARHGVGNIRAISSRLSASRLRSNWQRRYNPNWIWSKCRYD